MGKEVFYLPANVTPFLPERRRAARRRPYPPSGSWTPRVRRARTTPSPKPNQAAPPAQSHRGPIVAAPAEHSRSRRIPNRAGAPSLYPGAPRCPALRRPPAYAIWIAAGALLLEPREKKKAREGRESVREKIRRGKGKREKRWDWDLPGDPLL